MPCRPVFNRSATTMTVVTPLYSSVKEGGHRLHKVYDAIAGTGGRRPRIRRLSGRGRPDLVRRLPASVRAVPALYTNDRRRAPSVPVPRPTLRSSCAEGEGGLRHIAHGNDWQTGMLPLYLKSIYADDPLFASTRSVFTIHNLAYQGVFGSGILPDLSLGQFQTCSTRITCGRAGSTSWNTPFSTPTSSRPSRPPTPARSKRRSTVPASMACFGSAPSALFGILNGIDSTSGTLAPTATCRPSTPSGPSMTSRSTRGTCSSPGASTRRWTSRCSGVVTRLTGQKGVELMIRPLARLLSRRTGATFVALGSGERKFEDALQWLASSFPGRASFHRGYDEPLAHLIEGGADAFLMPSLYEPSGLNQMYSLAYGTAPIVRRTGGLADTVSHYDPGHRRGNRLRLRSLLRRRADVGDGSGPAHLPGQGCLEANATQRNGRGQLLGKKSGRV